METETTNIKIFKSKKPFKNIFFEAAMIFTFPFILMMIGWNSTSNIWVANDLSIAYKLVFYLFLIYWVCCIIKVALYFWNRIKTPTSLTVWNKGIDIDHILYNFKFNWNEINSIILLKEKQDIYKIVLKPFEESSIKSKIKYRIKKYFSRNLRRIQLESFHQSEELRCHFMKY